ncbi:hypothetical protein P9112_010464 [Eukaryota sp. TZLM1-RC]
MFKSKVANHLTNSGGVKGCSSPPPDLVSSISTSKAKKLENNIRQLETEALHLLTSPPSTPLPLFSLESLEGKRRSTDISSQCHDQLSTNGNDVEVLGVLEPAKKIRRQLSLKESFSPSYKKEADLAILKFFLKFKVPFYAASSNEYKTMVQAINVVEKDYKPPSTKRLSGSMIDEYHSSIIDNLSVIVDMFDHTGVSLVSDGWSDRQSRPLINLLAVTPTGSMFLTAFDTSGGENNSEFIAEIISKYLQHQNDKISIKVDSVIQIVTDNAPSCVAAGKILEKSIPLFFTGCAAHSID